MVKIVIEFFTPEANQRARILRQQLTKSIEEALEQGTIKELKFTTDEYSVNFIP